MNVIAIAERHIGETDTPNFTELVYKEAYPEKFQEFDKLFDTEPVKTFKNFRDAAYLIGAVPRAGDMVIWQNMKDGKPLNTGHSGVVVEFRDTETFLSIEGSTSDGGVAKRLRKVIPNIQNGLKILGFIQMK